MAELTFEWDPRKSRANFKKHGVTFDEAETAFYDEGGLLIDDPEHSDDEDRFLLLGLSTRLRELVVSHCYREVGGVIRIISARKAIPRERQQSRLKKAMKAEYDFSEARRNPYAKKLKKQITIRLEEPTIDYFKDLASEMDVPYQTLINLYLRDCAQSERKLNLKWK